MLDTTFERNPYRKLSGIYIIRSTLDDRCYVGSAKSIAGRHKSHRIALLYNKHVNLILQNFADKYGIENLSFQVLEYCGHDQLIEREQYWLDELQPAFNILKIARSALGHKRKPLTDEQRKNVREAQQRRWQEMTPEMKEEARLNREPRSQEHCAKLSAAKTGQKHTEETKQKISETLKGRPSPTKGRPLSEEHKEKCRIASTGRKYSEEIKAKRAEAVRKSWVKRKARGDVPFKRNSNPVDLSLLVVNGI